MRKTTTRALRVTHPTPETLVPFALGAPDPATAQHVAACPACSAEVDRLREATALLRTPAILETQVETTQCLDESTIANFVEGALAALVALLQRDPKNSTNVVGALAWAGPGAVKPLVKVLQENDVPAKRLAAVALSSLGRPALSRWGRRHGSGRGDSAASWAPVEPVVGPPRRGRSGNRDPGAPATERATRHVRIAGAATDEHRGTVPHRSTRLGRQRGPAGLVERSEGRFVPGPTVRRWRFAPLEDRDCRYLRDPA